MTRISEVAKRTRQYSFELSGDLLHRSMIAKSLTCDADHPGPFGLHADHCARSRLHHERLESDAADVYRKAVGTA